jgi:hypothetical protein
MRFLKGVGGFMIAMSGFIVLSFIELRWVFTKF